VYAVTPTDPWFVWGGYYEPASLVWHSRWVTSGGVVECREALAFPGDRDRTVLLRRVLAVDGPARVQVALHPRARFDRDPWTDLHRDDGTWTARTGPLHLRWSGAPDAHRRRDGSLACSLEVAEGGQHDLVLELSTHRSTDPLRNAAALWRSTEASWTEAVPPLEVAIAEPDAHHAYAVLRGMTSEGGGMVAAATTGLPERAEQGRNYDYRYAWIRDQCYIGQAIAATGAHPLLDAAVSFVADRLLDDGPKLKPAYTVEGGALPDEHDVPRLPGYPGGEARVGNRVNHQFQLDGLGEALLLFGAAGRRGRLDHDHWNAVQIAVAAIESRRGEADAGIWELEDQRWAHSRLICAAGLRSVAGIAGGSQASRWADLADAIVAEVGSDCVHPSGRWQRAPADDRPDASLLLPGLRGAVPTADPRSRATLAAVEAELSRDGYVYRFPPRQGRLAEAEGAFLLSGFHMALAFQAVGRPVTARGFFERNRAACGPPGLFTEEFDVAQRQLRGNFPQAFVHGLLLEGAARLGSST
jgi:GH15 family glucan-1,4-alpha-glucosidase